MQKQSNIEALKKKGVLSAAATKSLEKSGGISKRKSKPMFVFETEEGKDVIPMLYMRNGKGLTLKKEGIKFLAEHEKLVKKFATIKNNKESK